MEQGACRLKTEKYLKDAEFSENKQKKECVYI